MRENDKFTGEYLGLRFLWNIQEEILSRLLDKQVRSSWERSKLEM